jgi:MraZ protein
MLKGFYGTYTPRMDDKGRVTLPARYREAFAGGAMIVRGQDHCLYVFTPEGFEEFAESAINAPITDERARGYQRYMLANTDEQRPDAQGRISITARMREYAGLTKDRHRPADGDLGRRRMDRVRGSPGGRLRGAGTGAAGNLTTADPARCCSRTVAPQHGSCCPACTCSGP